MKFLTSYRSKQHWFAFLSRFLKINFAINLSKYEINVMKYITFLSKAELDLHCIASDICWILQKARKLYVKVSKNWYKKHINKLFPSLLLFWKEAGNLGSKFNIFTEYERMQKHSKPTSVCSLIWSCNFSFGSSLNLSIKQELLLYTRRTLFVYLASVLNSWSVN